MADLASHDAPRFLRTERPQDRSDVSGLGTLPGTRTDRSEEQPPQMNRVEDTGSLGVEKPTVSLDEDAVREAEPGGEGDR